MFIKIFGCNLMVNNGRPTMIEEVKANMLDSRIRAAIEQGWFNITISS